MEQWAILFHVSVLKQSKTNGNWTPFEIVYPGARDDDMWFEIGGRATRFGKQEFLLITGLRFEAIPPGVISIQDPCGPQSVQYWFFINRNIYISSVIEVLLSREFEYENDILKMVYVYIVAYVFMGKDKWKPIPNWL